MRSWLLAGLFSLGTCIGSFAQSVLPVPALSARVIDQTATLSATDDALLESALKGVALSQGAQIVILIVPTTQPEDIFSYSNRVANTWKIGRKEDGDGILIVVAKNDQKLRIEIAKSLEGAIPDLAASDIVTKTISPFFKQQQYAQGLIAGVDQLSSLISKAAEANRVYQTERFEQKNVLNHIPFAYLLALIFIFGLLVKYYGFGNTLLLVSSLSRGGNSAAYSSGGGGFSSGGGGDFGGGGASGDW